MGKIIVNGVEFCGTCDEAKNIKYDNTSSGLESTTVQEAVDELSESLTNEDNESFNFGILNGVRGFFTAPSRADDSFIPFRKDFSIVSGVTGGDVLDRGKSCSVSGTFSAGTHTVIVFVICTGGTSSSASPTISSSSQIGTNVSVSGATVIAKEQGSASTNLITFKCDSEKTVKFTFPAGSSTSTSFKERAVLFRIS